MDANGHRCGKERVMCDKTIDLRDATYDRLGAAMAKNKKLRAAVAKLRRQLAQLEAEGKLDE